MKNYDIIFQNGHILMQDKVVGTLLIDTGAPFYELFGMMQEI